MKTLCPVTQAVNENRRNTSNCFERRRERKREREREGERETEIVREFVSVCFSDGEWKFFVAWTITEMRKVNEMVLPLFLFSCSNNHSCGGERKGGREKERWLVTGGSVCRADECVRRVFYFFHLWVIYA